MVSTFDPETFMATNIETPMETKFTPLPVGDYSPCYIDDVQAKEFGSGPDAQPMLVITYVVGDQKAKDFMGSDRVTIVDNLFLDFDENGRLAFGKNKNIRLGQLREACGQNGPQPWAPAMLRGQGPFAIKIKHTFNKKGEGPFANVERVTRAVG